jgi:hypothetical protein
VPENTLPQEHALVLGPTCVPQLLQAFLGIAFLYGLFLNTTAILLVFVSFMRFANDLEKILTFKRSKYP